MVRDRYGKRHHRPRECFMNDEGEKLIAIKNHDGVAQFSLNLTLLGNMRSIFMARLTEKYLVPDRERKLSLISGAHDPHKEYLEFIAEQIPKRYQELAS